MHNFVIHSRTIPQNVKFGKKQEGLDRLSGEEILVKSRNEGAIVLTSGLDFGDLLVASKAPLPSIIVFRLHPPMSTGRVNRYLARVIEKHAEDLERGALVSVSEKWIRVRYLPFGAN